ncbi:MAG TPA: DUF6807 family protein [Pirellulaceae bacterium]
MAACLLRAEGSEPASAPLTVEKHADRLIIHRAETPVATYIFRDDVIRRPYFAHVHSPSGFQVTRNHPPQAGIDPTDHDTMHPGIWLAFGDISGHDFWRNKAPVEKMNNVEHVEFVQPPAVKLDGADSFVTFVAKNRYVAGDKTICFESARHTIRATPRGYLFVFDSQFSGSEPFSFGDQEEMGLGIRLATPLTVKTGYGTITNSEGRHNEKEVWGRPADWCDYGGIVATKTATSDKEPSLRTGLLLVPHPQNFRPSWFHARDYGLLVANPFGQRAFTKGPASRIAVKPGETFRLRYGVWSYSANLDAKLDLNEMASEYVRQAEN